MSANFRGFQTPPPPLVINRQQLPDPSPPLVSNRQHLLDPPSPPRQPSSAFGRPPLYHCIQGKHTFWYEITMVSWLFRTEKHIWNKAGLICLFYTHLWHFKTPFIKFFSDSTPPRQHSSAFGLPPPPPPAADVICEQPLRSGEESIMMKANRTNRSPPFITHVFSS